MGGYFKWDSGQAETPPAHADSHENGGDDEISVAGLSGELADAQTPKTHASTHQSGGADAIKLDDLAAPDDNTDLDVSTAKHGLTPKAPDDVTKFLRGDGAWAENSVNFTDISSTSTVTGWSSFTSKYIYWKRLGDLVFVSFDLRGTSNATSASFTVPVPCNSSKTIHCIYRSLDNGGSSQAAVGAIGAGTMVVLLYNGFSATWTASGTKEAVGTMIFEAAS